MPCSMHQHVRLTVNIVSNGYLSSGSTASAAQSTAGPQHHAASQSSRVCLLTCSQEHCPQHSSSDQPSQRGTHLDAAMLVQ
jgi:hypothetical protein